MEGWRFRSTLDLSLEARSWALPPGTALETGSMAWQTARTGSKAQMDSVPPKRQILVRRARQWSIQGVGRNVFMVPMGARSRTLIGTTIMVRGCLMDTTGTTGNGVLAFRYRLGRVAERLGVKW